MSKKDNLEIKISNNTRNVSLEEFEALVNQYGHIGTGGKRAKAVIGKATLTYKRVNRMPTEYVTDLLDIIDNL
jgi:hypothetical protein